MMPRLFATIAAVLLAHSAAYAHSGHPGSEGLWHPFDDVGHVLAILLVVGAAGWVGHAIASRLAPGVLRTRMQAIRARFIRRR